MDIGGQNGSQALGLAIGCMGVFGNAQEAITGANTQCLQDAGINRAAHRLDRAAVQFGNLLHSQQRRIEVSGLRVRFVWF